MPFKKDFQTKTTNIDHILYISVPDQDKKYIYMQKSLAPSSCNYPSLPKTNMMPHLINIKRLIIRLNQFSRVETSSNAPVQNSYTTRPKVVQPQRNSYYNTTSTQQQQQYDPNQFDAYYSVYDEDVDLYRDVG